MNVTCDWFPCCPIVPARARLLKVAATCCRTCLTVERYDLNRCPARVADAAPLVRLHDLGRRIVADGIVLVLRAKSRYQLRRCLRRLEHAARIIGPHRAAHRSVEKAIAHIRRIMDTFPRADRYDVMWAIRNIDEAREELNRECARCRPPSGTPQWAA